MGKFVELNFDDLYRYEALEKNQFSKVMALENILNFYKFKPYGKVFSSETFFDTPNNLLASAGINLSRIQEDDKVFFKVAPLNMSTISINKNKQKVFAHKVALKDNVVDHSFYLIDGIRGLFSTSINIDLENVIKNVVPKMTISTDADMIKVISGSGFRCYMCFENTKFQNFETKKSFTSQGITVKHVGPSQYMDEFHTFNENIQKHCKSFMLVSDNVLEHAKLLTKKVDSKQVKQDIKAIKQKILEEKKIIEE